MQVSQISLLQLLTDSFISLRDTDDNLALQTFCTGVGLEVEEEKAAAAAPPQGETMSQLLRDCSLFPDDQLQEEPSSAGPAAVTHGNWEWHPAHTSAECCKDFHSKQRQSCETSLMVLAESSVPRAQREAAWWDELHDAMRKDHAILKEVRDTIRNLKDTVDKSSADFQSSNDIFKKALQKYLKNEWLGIPLPVKGEIEMEKEPPCAVLLLATPFKGARQQRSFRGMQDVLYHLATEQKKETILHFELM
ncbi:hypothetical protein Y1Q_0000325 [Alligator mississippiensis]|uniref:Uncharacterized protein n=1 Tax=Alligator mississippiensis TaxID=8496 RepID=A0A151LZA3_ALLMI|nr:hypothetical protein Y1Q_0000325 [Alligator mississippiensis]